MKIAFLGRGTRGDFQPLLAVGRALADRGHDVSMTVNEGSAEWAQQSGLDIIPMPPHAARFLKSPAATEMLARGKAMQFLRAVSEIERQHNERIIEACIEAAEGADLIVSTQLMVFRGQCLSESLRVPHGQVHFYPSIPTSQWASILSPFRDMRSGVLNRATGELLYRAFWNQVRPNIEAMRRELGLPQLRSRPRVEGLPSVQAYSASLCPRPKDWGSEHQITGFVRCPSSLREKWGEALVDPRIDEFLACGPPPLYFGFGSMPVRDPKRLIEELLAVIEPRGLRALVGAGWSDFQDVDLPPQLMIAEAFDHDAVLPRCRAAVHHGGAGTTAAALRAGLPSVVAPVFADQPFWAERVRRVGAGVWFPFRRMNERRLGAAIDEVLSPRYGTGAASLGEALRIEASSACDAAVEVIESWLLANGQHL